MCKPTNHLSPSGGAVPKVYALVWTVNSARTSAHLSVLTRMSCAPAAGGMTVILIRLVAPGLQCSG